MLPAWVGISFPLPSSQSLPKGAALSPLALFIAVTENTHPAKPAPADPAASQGRAPCHVKRNSNF